MASYHILHGVHHVIWLLTLHLVNEGFMWRHVTVLFQLQFHIPRHCAWWWEAQRLRWRRRLPLCCQIPPPQTESRHGTTPRQWPNETLYGISNHQDQERNSIYIDKYHANSFHSLQVTFDDSLTGPEQSTFKFAICLNFSHFAFLHDVLNLSFS